MKEKRMRVLVEDDAVLRILPVLIDPGVPEAHREAVADWFAHDEPDFAGWCRRLHQQIPGLYPAETVLARDQEDLRAKIAEADALVVEGLAVGEQELARAGRLAIVQRFGMLPGNVDVEACAQRGVAFEVQRRRVNVAVAEQAIALMLALAKRIGELDHIVTAADLRRAGFDPTPFDRRYTGNSNFARIPGLRTMCGAGLGIIGLGEIGREIARRAAAFEMKLLYHQRRRINPLDEAALGARYVGLDELLENSDYIAIQLPLEKATRGFLGREQLRRVKPGAVLINVARAELVDHDALIETLESGRLAGFGLDVGYQEPWPEEEKLLQFRKGNVILMPHTAIAERQNGLKDMEEMCLKLWRATQLRRRS